MVKIRFPKWLFCLPALVVLALVMIYPLARTLVYSFTNARLGNLDHPFWVGFENYSNLFQDTDWWRATSNTVKFMLLSVFLETALGLAIALLLNSQIRWRGAIRTAVLIPWAIPAVVS